MLGGLVYPAKQSFCHWLVEGALGGRATGLRCCWEGGNDVVVRVSLGGSRFLVGQKKARATLVDCRADRRRVVGAFNKNKGDQHKKKQPQNRNSGGHTHTIIIGIGETSATAKQSNKHPTKKGGWGGGSCGGGASSPKSLYWAGRVVRQQGVGRNVLAVVARRV